VDDKITIDLSEEELQEAGDVDNNEEKSEPPATFLPAGERFSTARKYLVRLNV
jgi:hypothetical protein